MKKCQSFTATMRTSETTSFVPRRFMSTRIKNPAHDDRLAAVPILGLFVIRQPVADAINFLHFQNQVLQHSQRCRQK